MLSQQRLDSIFARIEAESPTQCAERWRGRFDRVASALGEGLVLFGAGEFGRFVLERLRSAGVEPCCFADNNSRAWGSRTRGVEVLSPADAVQRFGQTASFVVTVFNGSKARAQLAQLGCRSVLPATLLFWKYPEQLMPDLGIGEPGKIAEQERQIRECFARMSDEQSRLELCDQIEWRYWMEPESLPMPANAGEIYFPSDLVKDDEAEVFVDCGAFDGDSIRSFLRRGRTFSHLYALEPDDGSRALLSNSIAALPEELRDKITVWPYATGDFDGKASFVALGSVSSKISASGEGSSIESRRMDSIDWPLAPTYIKMDIEGSEPDALAGGARLLAEAQPVLAICLYHRLEHLWQIPNLIHSLVPDHRLFLRRYAEDNWEQVCYAVPPARLAGGHREEIC